MNRTIFFAGSLFGLLAVVFGAFGAHGLGKLLDAGAMDTFETGVKYQMYHALFLLVLGSVRQIPENRKKWILYCILMGIPLFSFSIYLLATNTLTTFDFSAIGWMTPLGGTLFIAAWVLFGYYGLRYPGHSH